jgi:hypothetical protein
VSEGDAAFEACPVPASRYDRVVLAHGGGGRAALLAFSAEQAGNMRAAPTVFELPTVVRALEPPTCNYTAQRQRHIAMWTAIQERRRFAVLPAKKHEWHAQHAARERLCPKLCALTRDVPKSRKPRDRHVPLGLRRKQFFVQHRVTGS